MNMLDLEQGSDAWKVWRRSRRMASLSPAVMNASPWQTRKDVIAFYRDGKDSFVNAAMAYGHAHEAEARAVAAGLLGEFLTPCVVEQGEYAASLDGLTDDGETLVEAKCPWKGVASETYKAALQESAGGYRHQLEHQLMVTGCKRALFVVWTPEQSVHFFVYPNAEEQAALRTAWDSLWAEMLAGKGLERDDKEWLAAVEAYREAKAGADVAQVTLAEKRETLLDLVAGDRDAGGGLTVQKVERKANVDYKAIPELAGVDLELYRGQPTISWRIDEAKQP